MVSFVWLPMTSAKRSPDQRERGARSCDPITFWDLLEQRLSKSMMT